MRIFNSAVLLFLILSTSYNYSQFGTAPTFPEGEQSVQNRLPDKIIATCSDNDTLHIVKSNPVFGITSPSLFTKDNIKKIFVFLTQIDSSYLFTEDCDYSMLKFLRLKTNQNNLSYSVRDSAAQIVNNEKVRIIEWRDGIKMFLFDKDRSFSTVVPRWLEFWECGEKADYAPVYPFVYPEKTDLVRKNTKEMDNDLYFLLTNPIFVLSVIPLDEIENEIEWLTILNGRTKSTELRTTQNRTIEGKGIDLNGDKISDAFWFVEVSEKKIISWVARLYLNIEGNWVPVWYTYFREN